MKIVKPNYFQCPNDLIDHWMPLLSEGELKILLFVIRQTFGWNKERDYISLSQFEKATGLSKPTVCKSTQSLVDKGVIRKEITGKFGKEEIYYSLVVEDENTTSDDQLNNLTGGGKESLQGGVKNFNTQKTTPKDMSLKRQQQPAAAAAVFSCVKSLDIPQNEKIWLCKKYTEPQILHALEYCASKPPTESFIQQLKWACDKQPKIIKTKKTRVEDNKKYADEIEESINDKLADKKGYQYVVSKNAAGIYSTQSPWSFYIDYTDKEFQEKLGKVINERLKGCFYT